MSIGQSILKFLETMGFAAMTWQEGVMIGVAGVMTIDIVTFTLAVTAVLMVVVPQPQRSAEGTAAASNIWREALYGFVYIWRRKSLLGVQLTFAISNFFSSIGMVLIAPMVLVRTASNELALAAVQSAMGIGGLVGGLAMTVWGGPKHRVHGVLLGFIGSSLLGLIPLGLGQNATVWAIGAFWLLFFFPITNASNQALWQAKVPPDVQGRVFATRRLIAQISGPLGILLAAALTRLSFFASAPSVASSHPRPSMAAAPLVLPTSSSRPSPRSVSKRS